MIELRRRVVLGNKLLYTSAIFVEWHQQAFVHSPEEVIEVLRQRGGCRWLVVEMGTETEKSFRCDTCAKQSRPLRLSSCDRFLLLQ